MEDKTVAVNEAIQALAADQGVDLVECRIFLSQGSYMVRCLADLPSGGISVGECARLNREVAGYLEASKALGENFIVEVNSPGLDRRLETRKDFLRVKNREISLWFNEPHEGRTCLEGTLIDVGEDSITMRVKESLHMILISEIKVGKLRMLTNNGKSK